MKLSPSFSYDWHSKVGFDCRDATNDSKFCNYENQDYTHIYSYNKVMTKQTLIDISSILNNTEFLVLVWYFKPSETKSFGLQNFTRVYKKPMLSTGGEKFTAHIYIKLNEDKMIIDYDDNYYY